MPRQTLELLRRPIPFLEASRQRFGSTFTVRVARAGELVIVSDPGSIKTLFGADRENELPPGRAVVLEPLLGRRSVLVLEEPEHMRMRRLMLPPFHGERMRAYGEQMGAITREELASRPPGEEFRLHTAMQAITLEVILRIVFGVAAGQQRERLRALLVEVLELTQSAAVQVAALASRRFGRFGPYGRVLALRARLDALLLDLIAATRRDPKLDERDDILALLLSARFEDGTAITDDEARDQLVTLLLAGHETTATALSWTLDLTLHRPEVNAAARAAAASPDGDRYLDALANEALRLRPVVPMVGRRIQAAMEIGGRTLPAETNVMPSIWLTHTDPAVFPDPHQFRPERFLDTAPETYSWIPFGGGTRRCLGAAFAQFEMRVVLRELFTAIELESLGPEEAIVRRNVTFAPRDGVRVRPVR